MRRYAFLNKNSVFEALNKLRTAFLAAKNGAEVENIIKAILTHDERMKIGRRIQIAQLLKVKFTYQEIANELKVGIPTIVSVVRNMEQYPDAYKLIIERENKVEKIYRAKAYIQKGSPKKLFKKKEYTGFTRKSVER